MGQVAWRADERPVQQGGAVNVQRDGAQGQRRTGQRQGTTQSLQGGFHHQYKFRRRRGLKSIKSIVH